MVGILTLQIGPQMKVDRAILIKTREFVVVTVLAETEKAKEISGTAANRAVEDIKAANTIQLATNTTKTLRHNGKGLASQSGSSGVESLMIFGCGGDSMGSL